jgi:hypothetical protein
VTCVLFDATMTSYLLGYELLDGILCDVGVGGADHEGDRDLAGGVILLRDDGGVGDGRVREQQRLELCRRHLHGCHSGSSQKRERLKRS